MVSSKTFYAPSFSSDTLLDAFLNARILVRLAILMQTPPGSVAIDVAFDTDMARREQELTQAAVVAELEIRTKVQCLIWLGTDGQVLEALGVKSADGEVDVYKVRFVLIRLRHVLEETLRRERRGHEDDLKRKFLEKCIKVCEQIVPETEATAQTPYLASASSSSSIITIDADSTAVPSEETDSSYSSCSTSSSTSSNSCSKSLDNFAVKTLPCCQNGTTFCTSKPRPWTTIRRATRNICGKLVSTRS